MRLSTLTTTFAILTLAIFPAASQEAARTIIPSPQEDAEIQALEDEYATAIVAVRSDLGEKYLNALKELQVAFTTRRQIEQALLVKIERERITEILKTAPLIDAPSAGAQPQHAVTLDISLAHCSGGARYDDDRRGIRKWGTIGATALWDLDAEIPPGRYEIILRYATGPNEGGAFEVFAGGADSVQGSIAADPDADWSTRRNMLAGTIVIGPDTRTFAITCTSLERAYLWILYGVTLAPPGTWDQMEKSTAETLTEPPIP